MTRKEAVAILKSLIVSTIPPTEREPYEQALDVLSSLSKKENDSKTHRE